MAKEMDGSTKGRKFYSIVPKVGKNKITFQRKNNKINRARLGTPTIEKIGNHATTAEHRHTT